MTTPPPPAGLFGIPNLDDVTKLLPPQVADAIKGTLGTILNPNDPAIKIGDPQPPGPPPIPVAPATKEMSGAVKALDTMIGAIDAMLRLAFLIPDQYEEPLRGLRAALATVRGWLD